MTVATTARFGFVTLLDILEEVMKETEVGPSASPAWPSFSSAAPCELLTRTGGPA
jgi:hypothetical protein